MIHDYYLSNEKNCVQHLQLPIWLYHDSDTESYFLSSICNNDGMEFCSHMTT